METLTSIPTLPPAVQSYVGAFAARKRSITLIRAIGVALVFATAWMAAWALVDRLIPLPQFLRVLLLLINVAAMLAIIWRPLRAVLRREVDWLAAAAEIERRNPRFGQRLQTVTSQLLSPAPYRGSSELLERLSEQVAIEAAGDQPTHLAPLALAARPWAIFAAAWLAILSLVAVPWLDVPTLLARQMLPLQPIRPATATHLEIEPGHIDIVQGQPLRISVAARRLGDSPVTVRTSSDGISWTSSTMTLGADDRHVYTLPSVERDLRYQVIGGDAESDIFNVRVLRRPAVAQFQMRYTFPAYIDRPPATLANTDGLIEAPVGTEATITLTATEPLLSAVLVVGDERIVTEPLAQANQRQAKLIVRNTMRYDIEMVSAHNIPSSGPTGMTLRAVPDRAPAVQLQAPSQDMRLHPRDLLDLPFHAADDYGLASLEAAVLVNDAAARTVPLTPAQSPRLHDGALVLDLSELNVGIGDVVSVTLTANDRIGQRGASDTLRVLIAPHSISHRSARRIAELKESHVRAERLLRELQSANATAANTGAEDAQAEVTRLGRDLSAAGETARLLARSLVRAIAQNASPALATRLAMLADQAETIAAEAEALTSSLTADPAITAEQRRQVERWLASTDAITPAVQALWHGEEASRLLADRQNLLAAQFAVQRSGQRSSDAFRRAMDRARREILVGVADLSLNPLASDLDALLEEKVRAAEALLAPASSSLSSGELLQVALDHRDGGSDTSVLAARLELAIWAQAMRRDADFTRALELRLAQQALATDVPARARQVEELVLRACALTVAQEYDAVRELDRQRRRGPQQTESSAEEQSAAEALSAAQDLMRIAQQQLELYGQTRKADPDDAFELSQRQDELLTAMERAMRLSRRPHERHIEEFSSRARALTAVRATRQRLAAIRAQLVTGEAIDMASATALAARLEPFTPETAAAAEYLRQQVEPALAELQQSRDAADAAAVRAASARAGESIAQTIDALDAAHDALATRQPAPAARWFARQASQALLRRDTDLNSAAMDQANAAAALQAAAQQEAWRACRARLATLPAAATYFKPSPPNETAARLERLFARLPEIGAARDLRPVPARSADGSSAPPPEIDPPEYQDALRAYFHQISRLRNTPQRR